MTTFRQYLAEQAKNLVGLRPDPIQRIVDEETANFQKQPGVTVMNGIPDTDRIPIENPTAWIQVPEVICCFVDMEGSTRLSAEVNERGMARAYRYFTQTAVSMYHYFESPYIDVRGDGVFALFDKGQTHRALAATVSFKTFVAKEFTPKLKAATNVTVGGHFGIDRDNVLVRKIGLKAINRTDRQNEVWAGKPINMAAKLASLSTGGKLLVSDRFFDTVTGEKALRTCGCVSGKFEGVYNELWQEVDLSEDDRFDFDLGYSMGSNWCETHGKEFLREVVRYDGE